MKHPREQTVKKIALITAWLVDTPEAYKGKTNEDIEKEILEEISLIPYIARIERALERIIIVRSLLGMKQLSNHLQWLNAWLLRIGGAVELTLMLTYFIHGFN